jgi:hypothetical protein
VADPAEQPEALKVGGKPVPTESKTVRVWRLGCPFCQWKTSWHTKPLPDLQSELIRHVQAKHGHAA